MKENFWFPFHASIRKDSFLTDAYLDWRKRFSVLSWNRSQLGSFYRLISGMKKTNRTHFRISWNHISELSSDDKKKITMFFDTWYTFIQCNSLLPSFQSLWVIVFHSILPVRLRDWLLGRAHKDTTGFGPFRSLSLFSVHGLEHVYKEILLMVANLFNVS